MRQIIVGQLISLLIAGTGIFSSLLESEQLNFPIFLCFCNYVLLSLFIFRRSIVSRLCPSCYGGAASTSSGGKVSVLEMLMRRVDDVVVSVIDTDAPPAPAAAAAAAANVAEERVAMVDRCARLSKLLCGRYVLAGTRTTVFI